MTPFEDSDFVVTFTGESPDSRVIRTWDRVLAYIDYAVDGKNDGWTCRSVDDCPELHDHDEWTRVSHSEDGDLRHCFDKQEFVYCVGLHIVRLTEPIKKSLTSENHW